MSNNNKQVMPVLNLSSQTDKMFFGDNGHGISRYDIVKYPIFTKLDKQMKSFFWQPHEFDMSREKSDYDSMTSIEQFVFTSNLKRQILLDSVQGRAPGLAFLPLCTDSTLENCILSWGFFEGIHSESYTHILRAIYPDPSVVIDDIQNISQIADCAHDITFAYDQLRDHPNEDNLYLALVAANALEAIRFYVSFACTFNFLERSLVEGSAKIVKFIARDENIHLALTQHILRNLVNDDPIYKDVIERNRQKAIDIFMSASLQEKQWAKYLFQYGSIQGLNEEILCEYVDYLTARRMHAIGLSDGVEYKNNNPLPWMSKHLNSSEVQLAPQEVELQSYVVSAIDNDVENVDYSKAWNSL